MTELTDEQHEQLDRLAEDHPEAKVVAHAVNEHGGFCPVIEYRGTHRFLDRDGDLLGAELA